MYKSKISPEEALELIKVRMNYDTKKTLRENKNPISEQSLTQTAGSVAGGALARGAGSAMAGTLATTLGATGSAVPIVGTAAGIIVGYGLGTLLDWAANHDYGESGFRKVMQACSAKGVSKLVPQLSKGDVRQIAYAIEDAKGQWNDNEDLIAAELAKIPTIADLCAVDKKIPGGLANFLDDLTDSPDEWKMFTRPLEGMIEDTEIILPPEEQNKTDQSNQRQQNINNAFCSVKNGKITLGGKTNGWEWEKYKSTFKVTDAEIEVSKKSCPKSKDGGTKKKSNTGTIKTPSELATVDGIKAFQNWLDDNRPGWASGYKGGVINRGKNGGGYGTFGPRTSAAWIKHKDKYLSGETNKQNDIEDVEVVAVDPNQI